LDQEIQQEIVCLLRELKQSPQPLLSEEEVEWVRAAIKREAKKDKLYDAVIEKSLGGLVWAFLVALGSAILMYVKDHLK